MIGVEQLAALPRGAFLINIGRGALIQQQALLEALHSGHLGGAALDVFEEEPLPAESPFWSAPNTFITPHMAGKTDRVNARRFELFMDNLARFRRGEPLLNVVDPSLGY